jgi:hypothetical protein
MAQTRLPKKLLESQLGLLAMRFRGARDETSRDTVAVEYAQVVRRLINGGTWKEIPPYEERLPGNRMPEEFYIYWSIPSPVEHVICEPTKPTVMVEGQDDLRILKAILPRRVLDACKLRPADGQNAVVEAAKTHVKRHHAPVAILLDTNTLQKEVIRGMVEDKKAELASVAGDAPFDVFCCVPCIEDIFFHGGIDFKRIFPTFKGLLSKQLARSDPKALLQFLFR